MYVGKAEPLPEPVTLRAGRLGMIYEQGDLRSIRLGDVEVLRRVYVAVRDRNWGTVAPVFRNVQIETTTDGFHVTYEVENRQGEVAFAWRGEIHGEASGRIIFKMNGEALSTFLKNRIGFCVLHPAAAAGKRCVVDHSDGRREEARFPVEISSDQPVLPFADMAGLAYEALPGVWVAVRLEGEVFEMEDQRNWTDASYKTFGTPLALPYPVEMRAGTCVSQRVVIEVRDERPNSASEEWAVTDRDDAACLRFDPDMPWAVLPRLGLGCASHGQPLTTGEMECLRALNLDHLRVDLPLDAPDLRVRLAQAAGEARALGCGLEVAVLVPEDGEDGWAALRAALEAVRPPLRGWLIYPAREQYQGGSPTRAAVLAARRHLAGWLNGLPLGTGTNTDFIFLRRTPQPVDLIDRVAVSINPQVHAFDNLSLVETLEAQPAVVRSASRHAGGLPVIVSPITLKPRFNPYATGAAPEPLPGQLPPQVDSRQMSLFAAGWTLGSLNAMLMAGAASVTYYETTGWRGVMETEAGSPLPAAFPSLPGGVFPLYYVLADAGAYAEGQGRPLVSNRPQAVSGLALRSGARLAFLLANHTPHSLAVVCEGLPDGTARARWLDELTFLEAATRPAAYRARPGEPLALQDGRAEIHLRPYAYALVEVD